MRAPLSLPGMNAGVSRGGHDDLLLVPPAVHWLGRDRRLRLARYRPRGRAQCRSGIAVALVPIVALAGCVGTILAGWVAARCVGVW